jgi:hypothetical protein
MNKKKKLQTYDVANIVAKYEAVEFGLTDVPTEKRDIQKLN